MAEVIVPFTVTNAQVLTLATAGVTIASFGENQGAVDGTTSRVYNTASHIAYVPKYLVIAKPADTVAFSLTRGLPHGTNDAATTNRPMVDRRGASDRMNRFFVEGGDADLVVRDSSGSPAFFVPADRLLQSAAATNMLVLPVQEGRVFFGGQFSFILRSNGVVPATGTVGLAGRLILDQVLINA